MVLSWRKVGSGIRVFKDEGGEAGEVREYRVARLNAGAGPEFIAG